MGAHCMEMNMFNFTLQHCNCRGLPLQECVRLILLQGWSLNCELHTSFGESLHIGIKFSDVSPEKNPLRHHRKFCMDTKMFDGSLRCLARHVKSNRFSPLDCRKHNLLQNLKQSWQRGSVVSLLWLLVTRRKFETHRESACNFQEIH